MPKVSRANVLRLQASIESWQSPYQGIALQAMDLWSPEVLFVILHAMRRWYSGQNMAYKLLQARPLLEACMCLRPKDTVGCFRGFKVDRDSPWAEVAEGETYKALDLARNKGFSSWSTTEAPTHRFSGGGKGKVGLIVQLIDPLDSVPVLAPPEFTSPWFNDLYAHTMGSSFRATEQEYLLYGERVTVRIVRVKRR
jgi:hypothetical protein